ncbi:hypothetical protein [Microbacterium paludicola]|uniref:MmyB family transcriptional regulator n=1 Tax=Microbacterium paludicola TaxID=300019 RepID=UPI003CD09976
MGVRGGARRRVTALRRGRVPRRRAHRPPRGRDQHGQPRFRAHVGASLRAPLHERHQAAPPPLGGDLDLDYEVLHLPEGDGQRLLTFTAPRGSASEAGLRLLHAA